MKEKIQHLRMVHGSPKWMDTGYKSLADARRINPTELPNFYRLRPARKSKKVQP